MGKPWTPADDRKLEELVWEGLTYSQIAEEMGRTYYSIHSRRELLRDPQRFEQRWRAVRERRSGDGPPAKHRQPWTAQELVYLSATMHTTSVAEQARHLGRTYNAVSLQRSQLGARRGA